VLPRRAAFHETRNDHQVETARRFAAQGKLLAAYDESGLAGLLDEIESHAAPDRISRSAPPGLLARIRSFALDGGGGGARWRP
jgi:hypothetical protein